MLGDCESNIPAEFLFDGVILKQCVSVFLVHTFVSDNNYFDSFGCIGFRILIIQINNRQYIQLQYLNHLCAVLFSSITVVNVIGYFAD